MTADTPDWQSRLVIAGSEINVPVSIQAATATLDVAIQSSSITFNVNISAAAVTLNINFSGQTVPVSSMGEYQADAGYSWFYSVDPSISAGVVTQIISLAIPAGATLYLYGYSYGGHPNAALWYSWVHIYVPGHGDLYDASQGGKSVTFGAPIKVAGGNTITVYGLYNVSGGGSANFAATLWGLLI